MDWIDFDDFLDMLKRFPGTEVTARYSNDDRSPRHRWTYLPDKKRYRHRWNGHIECAQEATTLQRYHGTQWNPVPFYHITDPKQQQLAIRLVEQLTMTGYLDDAINNCRAAFVRQCGHCHKLMDEGWIYMGCATFCSDECFLAVEPDLTPEDLREIDQDDMNLETYWTEWEE